LTILSVGFLIAPRAALPAAAVLAVSAMVLAMGADNYLSILFPLPAPAPGANPYAGSGGTRGLGGALVTGGLLLVVALLSTPLARARTAAGWKVTGVDRPEVMRRAVAARAIRKGLPRVEEVAASGLVVLAAPPRANLALLCRLAPHAGPHTVITDLGSVKSAI